MAVCKFLDYKNRVENENVAVEEPTEVAVQEEEEEENVSPKEEEEEEVDVDDFRKQLMSSWDVDTNTNEDTYNDNAKQAKDDDESIVPPQNTIPSSNDENENTQSTTTTTTSSSSPPPLYEFRSLLGDLSKNKLPPQTSGGDWINAIVKVVDENTVHSGSNEDDVIIILSPYTPEETVAVRRIISRYGTTTTSDGVVKNADKVIVLVNCKLNPLPRELIQAELVYGILPLMVQAKQQSQTTPSSPSPQEEEEEKKSTPKAVVLKRYPKDWEVFIDIGDDGGFESAGTASSVQIGSSKGPPPMEWIAGCMKMFMMNKRY
eukprot:15338013-Ditylum_brightwellii.AAC.1